MGRVFVIMEFLVGKVASGAKSLHRLYLTTRSQVQTPPIFNLRRHQTPHYHTQVGSPNQ